MNILLTAHIIIALASLLISSYGVFKPSRKLILTSYATLSLTLLSGSGLIIVNPSSLAHVCVTGLTFSLATIALSRLSSRKLSAQAEL